MAKLFGYPINLEADEDEGGSSINAEASRSSSSAGLPQRENNRYSESFHMDSESDLIDFFGRDRESHEDVSSSTCNVDICGGFDDVMEEDEVIELGLGIGLRGGDSVTVDKETDSGRVEVVTDLEDNIFCEEEAMLVAGEVLEWENLQNDITWESEPVQAPLFSEEEEEEEEDDTEEEEEYNANPFMQNLDDILMEAIEGTSLMDLDYGDFFLHVLGEEDYGDYYYDDGFAQSFNQEPPPVMGTRPASKKVVDDLPVVEITSEELGNGRIVCAICIGDVVVKEKVTRLPCRHYYHGDCIVPWLGMKNTCPVCRYELPTDDDLEYERSRRSQRLGTFDV